MLSSQRSLLILSRRRRQCLSSLEKPQRRNARGGGIATSSRINKKSANLLANEPSSSSFVEHTIQPPTRTQLWRVFCHAALPMVGFGFTDQTVMIQAGNAIDCTLGVTFGLTTLTAAAFGQICSNASGVIFGGTVERIAKKLGLPSAKLSNAQRKLPIVGRTKWAGSLIGVICGCFLGLLNLLFIDMDHSSTLKLQQFNEEQEFEFSIEASNAVRDDATMLTVKGPDVDGILASMTAALAINGASIVEIHAQRSEEGSSSYAETDESSNDATKSKQNGKQLNDIFWVVKRGTNEPFGDDELENLAEKLLDSTRTPMNVTSVKAAMNELECTNTYLQARIQKLEQLMYEKQITIVSTSGETHHPGGGQVV